MCRPLGLDTVVDVKLYARTCLHGVCADFAFAQSDYLVGAMRFTVFCDDRH